MRILLLTQLFYPEPNHLKGLTFAKELARRGHQVDVLTCYPNYPGGRLYPGYTMRPFMRETVEGIPITRVALYPSHDGSGLRRVACYGSFALSAAALGPLLLPRPDVVHLYQGPATLAWPAWMFKLLRGCPYVYDIQDLWPDSLAVSGMFTGRRGLAVVERWCRLAYRQARKIVVLSPGFKDELCRRGVAPEKIEVIYNWCDPPMLEGPPFDEAFAAAHGCGRHFTVMFAGTMGKVQALDAVLDAARLLQPQREIQFLFVGGGVEVESLRARAAALGLANVAFAPRQPSVAMRGILACADALLIHLRDHPLYRITIPQKTQAYLAAGKPIVIGVKGNAADLVQQAQAGFACEPEDPHSIANAVLQTYRSTPEQRARLGRNGRKFYDRFLAMPIGVEQYDRLFRQLVAPGEVAAEGTAPSHTMVDMPYD